MDRTKQPGIEIGQVVVERAVFEHRDDYLTLPANTKVEALPLQLRVQYGTDPTKQHGAIKVEINTDRSQRPIYVVEVVIVGLVRVLEGSANMPIEQYATVNGAALLLPFARELVANLTSRGRFGPVWLQPINLAAGLPAPAQAPAVAEPAVSYRTRQPRSRRK